MSLILNRKFARGGVRGLWKEESKIRYPTGEEVPIKFEEKAQIELGEFSLKFPLLVAEILDDCLLGVDFLKEIRLENIFEPIFGTPEPGRVVARIMDPLEGISSSLRSLFTRNLGSLLEEQKKDFANFLKEYQDVFSDNIVAGKCDLVEHKIIVKESSPIKKRLLAGQN